MCTGCMFYRFVHAPIGNCCYCLRGEMVWLDKSTQVFKWELNPELFQFPRKLSLALITWPSSLSGKDACTKILAVFRKRILVKEQYQRLGWEPEQTPAWMVLLSFVWRQVSACQSVPSHLIGLEWSRHILIFRRRRWSWHQTSCFPSLIYLILQHIGVHFWLKEPIMSTWLTKMLL